MTTDEAIEITGGLSNPSKMPCHSYNLPAKNCITGGKLHKVADSVCKGCYALKGFYMYPNVKNALEKRLNSISDPRWVEAMTTLIRFKEHTRFMRLHDSGDLQSVEHLAKIVQIARNLPYIQFWLPTREYGMLTAYLSKNKFPKNLTVRISAFMVDGPLPTALAKKLKLTMSGVTRIEANVTCPAPKQENFCGQCRKCWDSKVKTVVYSKH